MKGVGDGVNAGSPLLQCLPSTQAGWLRRELLRRAARGFEQAGAAADAADCLRQLGDTHAAATLLLRLGDWNAAAELLLTQGQHGDALLLFARWQASLSPHDRSGRVRTLLGQSVCHLLGSPQHEPFLSRAEGRRDYRAARLLLGETARLPPRMAAECWAALGEYGGRLGRFDLLHEGYERALQLSADLAVETARHGAAYLLWARTGGDRLLTGRLAEEFGQGVHSPTRKCAACAAELLQAVEAGKLALCTTCLEQSNQCEQPLPGYRFVRQIGQGALHKVFLAIEISSNSRIAVRALLPHSRDGRRLELLHREFEITRSLLHPNIVSCLEVIEQENDMFVLLEFASGGDLGIRLRQNGPAPIGQAVRWIIQVLEALKHVHDQGYVHRDIKPSNVLLKEDGETALLADFHLARTYRGRAPIVSSPGMIQFTPTRELSHQPRSNPPSPMQPGSGERDEVPNSDLTGEFEAEDNSFGTLVPEEHSLGPPGSRSGVLLARSGLTMSGDMGGTPAFMPPEQVTHFRDATPLADQYSAAASLYNLLTGKYIFDFSREIPRQLALILNDHPVPIHLRWPGIPVELSTVIHRALSRDPQQRYGDVLEFRDALLPFRHLTECAPPPEQQQFTIGGTYYPSPSPLSSAVPPTLPPRDEPPRDEPPEINAPFPERCCLACKTPFTLPLSGPPDDSNCCWTCVEAARRRAQPIEGVLLVARLPFNGVCDTYLAHGITTQSACVLKTIGQRGGSGSVRLMERQLELLPQFDHPGILPIQSTGRTTEGIPYFTTAFMRGANAGFLLNLDSPLDISRVAGWMCQVLEILEHVHARSCLHRDVKPRHFLIVPEQATERVYLTGFDLVCSLEDAEEQGVLVGTPAFMSPESLRGEQVGPASDLYAAGVSLFNLLTNEHPFRGSLPDIMREIQQNEPPTVSSLRPEVPARLDAIVRRALQKDPVDRFRDVNEMRDALLPFTR